MVRFKLKPHIVQKGRYNCMILQCVGSAVLIDRYGTGNPNQTPTPFDTGSLSVSSPMSSHSF